MEWRQQWEPIARLPLRLLQEEELAIFPHTDAVGLMLDPPIMIVFGWLWLVAGADLSWDKITAGWQVAGDRC